MVCRDRRLLVLVGAALGWRVALSAATVVPAEDGVNQLWMAMAFARGDFAEPVGEVFPPLLALLTALPVALGVPPFPAAQGILALAGACWLVPLAALAERVRAGSGLWAAALAACAPLPARYGAEIYTEPLFVLLATLALLAGHRQRGWRCGLWTAAAFMVRPEALVLPVALLFAGARRCALRSGLFLLLAVALLTLWRGLGGHGWDPLPKLSFNWERGLAESRDPIGNLLRVPGAAVEAWGPFLVLALFAAWRGAVTRTRLLWSAVGCGIVPIITFAVRRRFLVSWIAPVVVLAGAGLHSCGRSARAALLTAVVVLSLVTGWRGLTAGDRVAERALGEWLQQSLEPTDEIVTDMTRILWFAGRRPLPPRHVTSQELVASARHLAVRYLVLGSRRTATFEPVVAALGAAFAPAALPADLRALCRDRGLAVFERR